MNIDGEIIPLAILGVGSIITLTVVLTDRISKYKIKVEQIKADALVRAEEIREKNQLELEKLLRQEEPRNTGKSGEIANRSGQDYDEDRNLKSRLRE